MSFRKKLSEVLTSLNMKELPMAKNYSSSVEIDNIEDLFKRFEEDYQYYDSIIFLNESEREIIVAGILSKAATVLKTKFNIKVHIGCQTYVEHNEEYGFLDLCVFDKLSRDKQNIVVVLELKIALDSNSLGQLLSQLIAVHANTAKKVYGFLTSLDSWIPISFSSQKEMEIFNKINCTDINRVDLSVFRSIVETIVDIVVNYCREN